MRFKRARSLYCCTLYLLISMLVGTMILRSVRSCSSMRGVARGAGAATPSPEYISLLKQLYKVNMNNPVKMGLQNAQMMSDLLGQPLKGIPIVHVAGTNGKGSVSLKTAECLQRTGLRTGLFVSPHISSFRERIQVNGEILSEEDVLTLLPQLFQLCDKHAIPATFFELTTLLAFMRFQRAKCDAIVLEVGLGGRLDSTNIVTPALSIITSIQLDHTKILGDTIEKIAMEKAGIMKPGVNVLVGPGCPLSLMETEAKRVGAIYHTLDSVRTKQTYRKTKVDTYTGQVVPDDIDDLNSDITRAGLRLLAKLEGGTSVFARLEDKENESRIEEGLASRPPCRYQLFAATPERPVDVVLDIAHNEDAMAALARKVRAQYGAGGVKCVRIVLGMSADKDVSKCVSELFELFRTSEVGTGGVGAGAMAIDAASRFHCAAARHPRALSQSELQALINSTAKTLKLGAIDPSISAPSASDEGVGQSLRQAIKLVQDEVELERKLGNGEKRGLVLVCGTAFIMAAAREALGVLEPRDGDFLSENLKDAQENFTAR